MTEEKTWPAFRREEGGLKKWAEWGFRFVGGHPNVAFCLLMVRVRSLCLAGYRFRGALWTIGGGLASGLLEAEYRRQMGPWLKERVRVLRDRCQKKKLPVDTALPINFRNEMRTWNAMAFAACLQRPFPKLADQDQALALPDFEYKEALAQLHLHGTEHEESVRRMARAITRWLPEEEWIAEEDTPASTCRDCIAKTLAAIAAFSILFVWRPSK